MAVFTMLWLSPGLVEEQSPQITVDQMFLALGVSHNWGQNPEKGDQDIFAHYLKIWRAFGGILKEFDC